MHQPPLAGYDIRDFGAGVGSGADDQPALAAACAAAQPDGATVVIPPGVYHLARETRIPAGVTIAGTGRRSVLRALGQGRGFRMLVCAAGAGGQTVRDLCLDGNKERQNPEVWGEYAGVFAEDPRELLIRDCTFVSHPYACVLARAYRPGAGDVRVMDCEFRDFGYPAVTRSATALICDAVGDARITDVLVRGNRFRGGRSGNLAAIGIANASRAEIAQNRIVDLANEFVPGASPTIKGIDVLGSDDVRISGNEADLIVDQHWCIGGQDSDTGVQVGFAFAATGSRRVVISDNTANRVCAGIGAFDLFDFTIVGNVVVGDAGDGRIAGGCGLEINSNDLGRSGPACGSITGNTFRNLRTGIFVAYGRDLVLSGNVVQQVQKNGFNLVQGEKRRLTIAGNVIRNVGRLGNEAGGPYHGILLAGSEATSVTGNIVENAGPRLPLHCLSIDERNAGVLVSGNMFAGATDSVVRDQGRHAGLSWTVR
jgi:putative cofactor-binding repeat protein